MAEEIPFMKQLKAGWEDNNIYVLHDNDDTVIIDPCEDFLQFIKYLRKIHCTNLKILLTHGHEDHISAIPGLMCKYPNATILIAKEDLPFLTDSYLNGSNDTQSPINLKDFSSNFQVIDPNQKIQIGKFTLEVVQTPGHTQGSVIFIDHEHKSVYTGDTLFAGTIGATHFPGGNKKQMQETLKKIGDIIPDDYDIYPGHGELTTMKKELENNPYLQ